MTTNLNRSVQPNGGKDEGVRYGKVVSPSPVDWRTVVASFPVNCYKYILCSFMLCLNNVKPAAYKPMGYCRHSSAFYTCCWDKGYFAHLFCVPVRLYTADLLQGGPKKRIPSFIFGTTSVIQHRF